MYYRIHYKNELCHFGIKGQRWGERRYQNEDGSYTPEGRIHYGIGSEKQHGSFGSLFGFKSKKSSVNDPSLTEKQKKYGYTKDKNGVLVKKVNGLHVDINDDDDIDIAEKLIKEKDSLSKSFTSSVKKELTDMSQYTGIKPDRLPPLQGISVASKIGMGTFSYWYDDNDPKYGYGNDPLAGHILDVEFDLKSKKVLRTGIDG